MRRNQGEASRHFQWIDKASASFFRLALATFAELFAPLEIGDNASIRKTTPFRSRRPVRKPCMADVAASFARDGERTRRVPARARPTRRAYGQSFSNIVSTSLDWRIYWSRITGCIHEVRNAPALSIFFVGFFLPDETPPSENAKGSDRERANSRSRGRARLSPENDGRRPFCVVQQHEFFPRLAWTSSAHAFLETLPTFFRAAAMLCGSALIDNSFAAIP